MSDSLLNQVRRLTEKASTPVTESPGDAAFNMAHDIITGDLTASEISRQYRLDAPVAVAIRATAQNAYAQSGDVGDAITGLQQYLIRQNIAESVTE